MVKIFGLIYLVIGAFLPFIFFILSHFTKKTYNHFPIIFSAFLIFTYGLILFVLGIIGNNIKEILKELKSKKID
jgi:hypothetical protein